MEILNNLINATSHPISINKLKGLRAVLEVLNTKLLRENGLEYLKSSMMLEEAFGHYNSFIPEYTQGSTSSIDLKQFKELLCHPKYGLCVLIIFNPHTEHSIVCLRPDTVDIVGLTELLISDSKECFSRLDITYETVQSLIHSMDSEHDKHVAKVLLCANRSRNEIEKLGFKPDEIPRLVEKAKWVARELENVKFAAEDIAHLRLREQRNRLQEKITSNQALLEKRKSTWPEKIISQIEEDIDSSKERLNRTELLLNSQTPKDKKSFHERKRRIAEQLVIENRLKRRRLTTQGAPSLIDTDDEEFMRECVSDKSSVHGRRRDQTEYVITDDGDRIKRKDLKNIINYNLQKRGKKLIKSATTAYNRTKPKNIRSKQAKLHLGKGLICCKKPPKSEDCDNENTHYQRAHVKYVKTTFYGKVNEENRDWCFMSSQDDKAYIRPGTSEGFSNTKRGKIFTLTDEERSRKLPKYDWPEKLVFQTPASHRIFTKEAVVQGEEEKLVTAEDAHIVFIRPKAFVPSTGSTYKSEIVRIRHEFPDLFEVPSAKCNAVNYSEDFRCSCAIAHDSAFIYKNMTMDEDLKKVTYKPDCLHKQYEKCRIMHLRKNITKCLMFAGKIQVPEEKTLFSSVVIKRLEELVTCINECESLVETGLQKEQFTGCILQVKRKCGELLESLTELRLPPVKPCTADLTDKGPGQGVSNFDVRIRDAEVAMLYNSDYRIRVHRSRGDSGQGEAERTNSAIQDSVVDGGTIQWENHKRFEDLTEEQISEMNIKEYEQYEKRRMEKNAWFVTRELVKRIDGAPVLSTYIKAVKSENVEDLFFFNSEQLRHYQSVTSQNKCKVPGSAYINKVAEFFDNHYVIGELYMEYLRKDCERKTGKLCWFCKENDWVGPLTERIPQPIPDSDKPGHFKHVKQCSSYDQDGNLREPDDFLPRANLKKKFKSSEISLADCEKIIEFSSKFCVKEEYVVKYLQHLKNLELCQRIRTNERNQTKQLVMDKTYDDYDWSGLVEEGLLPKLYVKELDRYLEHHGLEKSGKKDDKIRAILCHMMQSKPEIEVNPVINGTLSDVDSNEDNSDDDIPLAFYKAVSDDDDEGSSDDDIPLASYFK